MVFMNFSLEDISDSKNIVIGGTPCLQCSILFFIFFFSFLLFCSLLLWFCASYSSLFLPPLDLLAPTPGIESMLTVKCSLYWEGTFCLFFCLFGLWRQGIWAGLNDMKGILFGLDSNRVKCRSLGPSINSWISFWAPYDFF